MLIVLLFSLLYQLFIFFIKFYLFQYSIRFYINTYNLTSFYTISFIRNFFDRLIVMFSRKDLNKSRQIIVKLKSLNEENGEEIDEEIVFIISAISHNNSLLIILISGFS